MDQDKSTSPPMRRWLRWLAVLVLMITGLLIAVRLVAMSGPGRAFVEARIEALRPAGQKIEIEGLEGDLLGRFTIERLAIGDQEGVWLEANEVSAVWHPLRLRTRMLAVDLVSADRIEMHRRPVLERSEVSGGGNNPIRAIDIGSVRVSELLLDSAVTTRELRLALAGAGAWQEDSAALELTLHPLEGDGDRVEGDLTWSRTDRLQGALNFDSPAGGLLASLVRLDPEQSLSGEIQGTGALDDWAGNLNARIDDLPVLSLNAQGEANMITYDGEANLRAHPLLTELVEWMGSPASLNGRADPAAMSFEANLSADRLDATLDLKREENGPWFGHVLAEALEPHQLADLAGTKVGRIRLDGDWSAGQAGPEYTGEIEAWNITRGDISVTSIAGPLNIIRGESDWQIETDLTSKGTRLPGQAGQLIGAQPGLQLIASVAPETRIASFEAVNVTGRAARLSATGRIDPELSSETALEGRFILNGQRAELPYGASLAGDWRLYGQDDGALQIIMQSRVTGLETMPEPLGGLLGSNLTTRLSGLVTREGAVRLDEVSFNGAKAGLRGTANLFENKQVDLDLDLESEAFSVSGTAIEPLSASLTGAGPLESLDFVLEAQTRSVRQAGLNLSNISTSAQGNLAGGDLTGRLQAYGQTDTGPASLTAMVFLSGESWQVTELEATLAGLVAEGALSGEGADLPALRANLTLQGPLPESIPAETVDATLQLTGDRVETQGGVTRLTAGPLRGAGIDWNVAGTPEALDLTARVTGDMDVNGAGLPLLLDLSGRVQEPMQPERALTLNARGELADQPFQTLEPIRLQPSPRGVEASFALSAFDGTARGQITDRTEERVRIELESISLEALLPLLGQLPRRGQLSAELLLRDNGPHLDGELTAELDGLYTLAGAEAPLVLQLDGQLAEEMLDLVATTRFEDSLDGNASLQIPLSTRADPLTIAMVSGASMPFRADLEGPIGPLADLVLNPDLALGGNIDLTLEGALPLKDNGARGELFLRDGLFEDSRYGLILKDVSLSAEMTPEALELNTFSANGHRGGSISGGGRMSLLNGATNLELAANRLVVFDRSEGRLVASGDLGLKREGENIGLSGELEIVDGTLNLDQLPQSGPPTLDVRFEAPDAPAETPEQRDPVTELKVRITAPRGVRLTGHGIEASLVLDAEIGGSVGDPNIVGTGRIERGRFDLLGKRFDVRESSVRINGDPDQADLDIRAIRTDDDMTAEIRITGTPRSPEVSLSSSPQLPQDEILSRLLFGRSPAELGPLETARLAAALAELSGEGGFDLLGGLEESLDLDTVDIGQSDTGSVELTTGKYLAEDVYLELRSSPDAPPGIALEWQPLDNIEVELETTSNVGESVSVRWKTDFD
ncbi:MAG: translocation/assembly module TamB domain-containing protein [Hyphomonadaceae bacterium]|nr:translocation/assembly module TamB domain-containing protein [Hyphomonadaceae bacterium]